MPYIYITILYAMTIFKYVNTGMIEINIYVVMPHGTNKKVRQIKINKIYLYLYHQCRLHFFSPKSQ